MNNSTQELWKKGGACVYKHDYAGAVSCYTQLLQLDPHNNRGALKSRAGCYFDLHQYNDAINDLSKYMSMEPDGYEGYWIRALCYETLGKLDEALADIDRVLQRHPWDPSRTYESARDRILQMKQQRKADTSVKNITIQTEPNTSQGAVNTPVNSDLVVDPKSSVPQSTGQPVKDRVVDTRSTDTPTAVHAQNSITVLPSVGQVQHSMISSQRSEQENTPTQPTTRSEPNAVLQAFEISAEELTLGEFIAEGAFGKVFKGTWRFNDVAIKQLNGTQLSEQALNELHHEASIMVQLRSPNIAMLYGVCTRTSPFYLVMEFAAKGSLFSLLRSKQEITPTQRVSFALDVAKGLAFLHASKILHRDLKSLNVLLDKQLQAKLSDFGLSQVKVETNTTSTSTSKVGTVAWMAPELFKRKPYTEKSDVFSFGMLCWEIWTRKIPYSDANGNQAMISQWIKDGLTEEIPEDVPPKIAELIRLCWESDPTKRPTAADAVNALQQL